MKDPVQVKEVRGSIEVVHGNIHDGYDVDADAEDGEKFERNPTAEEKKVSNLYYKESLN